MLRSSSLSPLCLQFLIQVCEQLHSQACFASHLCSALEHPFGRQKSIRPTADFLNVFRLNLRLTPVRELFYLVCLTKASQDNWRNLAEETLEKKVEVAVKRFQSLTADSLKVCCSLQFDHLYVPS